MKRKRVGSMLGVVVLSATAVAFVFVAQAAGRPTAGSSCKAEIASMNVAATSDTTAFLTATITSPSGGSWQINLSSPQTTIVGGTFAGPSDSISVGFTGLLPGTHYRGTLSVNGDCGGDAREIDFRTPNTPPRPPCTAAPTIAGPTIGSIAMDSAIVGYNVSSGDQASVHVVVTPGGMDVPATVSPPGGGGQVPLSGLTPNTSYTVTVVASNGCGESSRQATFVTLRATDCSAPPSVEKLEVFAIRPRSAMVVYRARSNGAGSVNIVVDGTGVDASRRFAAPGAGGLVRISKLRPARRYEARMSVDNACGHAMAARTFSSLARVVVEASGPGRVASSPGGISCGKDCVGAFKPGRMLTLTARPFAGARFAGWEGACAGTARTCTLKARNQRVRARFSTA